jgi:hypothetical protein
MSKTIISNPTGTLQPPTPVLLPACRQTALPCRTQQHPQEGHQPQCWPLLLLLPLLLSCRCRLLLPLLLLLRRPPPLLLPPLLLQPLGVLVPAGG